MQDSKHPEHGMWLCPTNGNVWTLHWQHMLEFLQQLGCRTLTDWASLKEIYPACPVPLDSEMFYRVEKILGLATCEMGTDIMMFKVSRCSDHVRFIL